MAREDIEGIFPSREVTDTEGYLYRVCSSKCCLNNGVYIYKLVLLSTLVREACLYNTQW